MEHILELSKNLHLIEIEENNYQNGELLAVECHFTFYGEDCQALIGTDRLDQEYASYGMIETPDDLHDSFIEQIEDFENWKKIVQAIKEFIVEWEIENAD